MKIFSIKAYRYEIDIYTAHKNHCIKVFQNSATASLENNSVVQREVSVRVSLIHKDNANKAPILDMIPTAQEEFIFKYYFQFKLEVTEFYISN